MQLYFFGTGTTEPAVSRSILETELMEDYHWLPQDIDKIPYKRLQKILVIKKNKRISIDTKRSNAEAIKNSKRRPSYREV